MDIIVARPAHSHDASIFFTLSAETVPLKHALMVAINMTVSSADIAQTFHYRITSSL